MTGASAIASDVAHRVVARRARCRPSCRAGSSRARPLRRTAPARRAAAAPAAGVGPVGRVGVRERHVAHAQLVILPQQRERVLDRVPALDADHRGDLAGAVDAHDVVGRAGELQVVRRVVRPCGGSGRSARASSAPRCRARRAERACTPRRRPRRRRRRSGAAGRCGAAAAAGGNPCAKSRRARAALAELPGQVVVPVDERGFARIRLARCVSDSPSRDFTFAARPPQPTSAPHTISTAIHLIMQARYPRACTDSKGSDAKPGAGQRAIVCFSAITSTKHARSETTLVQVQ